MRGYLGLIAVLVPLNAWAWFARDADFYLPDPFAAISLVAVVLWAAASAFVQPWRNGIRIALVVVPVIAIIGLEWQAWARDAEILDQRLVRSPDAGLRYVYRPGAETPDDVPIEGAADRVQLKINAHGMWDLPRSPKRKTDALRIALLGDSVPNDSFVPFDKRFHRRLEGELEKRLGRRVEVLNFAVEGYNTAQELRLWRQRGERFDIDLVLWAYVLNDPFIQDGSYRRVGHSFFVHRVQNGLERLMGASDCEMFKPLYRDQPFELVVARSFEMMKLVAGSIPVRVAVLPIVAPFSDRACALLYDRVADSAVAAGLPARKVVGAFVGKEHTELLKEGEESDVTHPNAKGHAIIAADLATWLGADPAVVALAREATSAAARVR